MKKILYVNTSDCVGGAAKVAWNLGHNLSNKYKPYYITSEKKSSEKIVFKIDRGFVSKMIERILDRRIFNLLKYQQGFILSNDIDYGFNYKDLKKNKFYNNSDVVHIHNLHGNYFNLSSLAKIDKPLVWTLHDEWSIMPHGAWSDKYNKDKKLFERNNLLSYPPMLFDNSKYLSAKKNKIYQSINPAIVVPSNWLLHRVEKSILADKEIILIPNGIDTNIYKIRNKYELRRKLGLPQDVKIILFLASGGRNNPQKGWEHSKKIIDRLNGSNFLFVCIGGNEPKIYREGNILYVPYQNSESKLGEHYSAADIFLFTSNRENLPLTILEAMSTGLPVAAFNVGGVGEEVLDGETGILTKMKDYSLISKKIVELLNNQSTLDIFSKNSRSTVLKKFTLKKMVDSYEKLYSKILK